MLSQLSKTLVCIQCNYKIIGIGNDLRAGRECPTCKCPMYLDGGGAADYRINRDPVDDVGFIMRVYTEAALLPGHIPGTPPTRAELVSAARAQMIPDAVRRSIQERHEQAVRERRYAVAATCAFLAGMALIAAILWVASHA